MRTFRKLFVSAIFLSGCNLSILSQVDDRVRIETYMRSLPATASPSFDAQEATALAAWPLSCVDHPQAAPEGAQYLWTYEIKPRLAIDYDKNRAFYGCYDWHSAVNSSWMMVALLKDFPDLPLARLIREKLNDHLGKQNILGEVEFFKQAKGFEKPYGYAWLLKLYAEIKSWNDPDATKLAANVQPLAQMFSEKLIEYFDHLPYPSRPGVHPNTSLSMTLVLDYTDVVEDLKLKEAVLRNVQRLFGTDRHCPVAFEPGGTEFLSPCLAEAQLISRTMDQKSFAKWLDDFLPPVYSPEFAGLAKAVDVSGIKDQEEFAGKSHLIGLAFHRAMAMTAIADALPAEDLRAAVLRKLAAQNASHGMAALSEAGYLGSHWLSTYAVLYLRTALHPSPQRPAMTATHPIANKNP